MQKTTVKKRRFIVQCACCGRILSSDCNDRPFRAEIMQKKHENNYDKITRCPRCQAWNGVYQ